MNQLLSIDLPFYQNAPGEHESIFVKEIFSPTARIFYAGVAMFWLLPFLVWEQMPDSAHWALAGLTVFAMPFFLWFAVGRRIIEINFSGHRVTVHHGLFLPFISRDYDLNAFDRVSIVEILDGANSGGATGATGIHRADDSYKVTAVFYLTGVKKLLLYEFCFNSKDDVSRKKYQRLKAEIPAYVQGRLVRTQKDTINPRKGSNDGDL